MGTRASCRVPCEAQIVRTRVHRLTAPKKNASRYIVGTVIAAIIAVISMIAMSDLSFELALITFVMTIGCGAWLYLNVQR